MATAVQQGTVSTGARGGRRSRFSAQERRQLVDRAMLRLADGVSLQQSAKEIGVCYETFRRWRMEFAPAARLRPVSVEKTVTAARSERGSTLSLLTAGGHRVEGLDLKTLVELVRRNRRRQVPLYDLVHHVPDVLSISESVNDVP